jgi:hypothetical protein
MPRQEQEQPPPGRLVARVDHDPQEGQDVLEVGLLEEPQAAADRVGDPAPDELGLQQDAVVVVAVQDGHPAQALALLAALQDLLAEEVGLLVGVGRRHDQGPAPGGRAEASVLGKPEALRAIEALVKATISGVER